MAVKRLLTGFPKGELSPNIEGRPDLAAYFEGGSKLENWLILKTGGITRRIGTRFVREVKDSTKDTIIWPFEPSVDDASIIELGSSYARFFKDKRPISGVTGAELITNGAFPTDLTGWIVSSAPAGTYVIWESPGLVHFHTQVSGLTVVCQLRQQGITVTPGSTYVLSFEAITNPIKMAISSSPAIEGDVLPFQFYDVGVRQVTFVAPGSGSIVIRFAGDEATTSSYDTRLDNVSLKLSITPFEIVAPYTEAQLREVHSTQSVDVVFSFHSDVRQQRLSRLADTDWTWLPIFYNPPPSFEADADISGGTVTLTPNATTGNNILFHASAAVFLEGDVGRVIMFGSSRALIKTFGSSAGDVGSPNDDVRCDILDAFPNTSPIAAGQWLLHLSPQTTLDPNIRAPQGAQATFVAGANAFRASDVGKFISVYGGLAKVEFVDSALTVRGELLGEMAGTADANPAAAPAGAWSLEVESWSTTNGFPKTGELFQGRLGQASTRAQKTTWWLSNPDDFDKYILGVTADSAVEYTMATRSLNAIQWLADNINLFIGTKGSEHEAKSGRENEPIGGDRVPLVERISTHGSAAIQPVVIGRRIILVDRSRRLIISLAFNWEADGFDPVELTGAAEHITESNIKLGPPAVQRRLYPVIYWVREDGQIVALTYNIAEKVIGFTRFVTDGKFQSVAVIPQSSGPDQLWAVVQRTINGVSKRYIEVFDENAVELGGRAWTSLQTDCAKVYDLAGVATTVLTGLGHLEGKTVDVVADGDYVGQYTVSGAQITLAEAASDHVEVGLHYGSPGATMRPAVEGSMVEGAVRSWNDLWLRVRDSLGGKVNGVEIQYPPQLAPTVLKTGDVMVNPPTGGDTDGRVTFEQHLPYPMTILAIFGEVNFGK